jgi:surface antigen
LVSCLPAAASPGGNCVAYARELTGIRLDGNAASWWPHAEGRYERGHTPAVGAVLVFRPYAGMRVGHVAVVSRIVGPREILVDQANWVRGRVSQSMSVVDASLLNDWTSVKVQYGGTHGRENPTYGFVYPRTLPASFGERIVELQRDHRAVARIAVRAEHRNDGHKRDEAKQTIAKQTIAKQTIARQTNKAKTHRLAGHEPAHDKHKAKDVRLAYVY